MSSNPIPALKNSTDASVLMATIFAPTTAFSSGSAKLKVPTSKTSRRPEGVCRAYVCPTTKSSSSAVSVSTANSVIAVGGLPSEMYNLGFSAVSSQLTPILGPRFAIAADPSDLFGMIPNSITRGCTPTTPSTVRSSSGKSRLIGAASNLLPKGISDRIARS